SHEIVFPAAIKSKDKLILFYLLPPATDKEALSRKLAEVTPKLKEAVRLIQGPPTRLILHLENHGVEFRSNSKGGMTPVLFILISQTYTGPFSVGFAE